MFLVGSEEVEQYIREVGLRALTDRTWDIAHSAHLYGLMYKAHLLIMRLTDDCILGKRIYSRNKPFIIIKWKIYVPRRQPFLLTMLHFLLIVLL